MICLHSVLNNTAKAILSSHIYSNITLQYKKFCLFPSLSYFGILACRTYEVSERGGPRIYPLIGRTRLGRSPFIHPNLHKVYQNSESYLLTGSQILFFSLFAGLYVLVVAFEGRKLGIFGLRAITVSPRTINPILPHMDLNAIID